MGKLILHLYTSVTHMKFQNSLTQSLKLKHPIVMAPMFLVSNVSMVKEAMSAGIMGCFPSLNFRKEGELKGVLDELNSFRSGLDSGTYGVNLIVQRSNIWFEKHLEQCVEHKVPVIITSLGKPEQTINEVHKYGGKVFCDITNLTHAHKCAAAGCDGFIAVGQGAGGHAGPFPLLLLIDSLKKNYPALPVLAAGGIANGRASLSAIAAGASAVYCGTRFIASTEATVSAEYKNAILDSHMDDIVMTDRISGTPCTVINTPYAQQIGQKQNFFEKWMSNNPRTKKYFKMLVQRRGFGWLEEAVQPGNYKTLWCAGQSVEMINRIMPVQEIVNEMAMEMDIAFEELKNCFIRE
jgi:nitronate monooxygenase